MTIKEAQERVDCWIKEYGVRYFNEMTNMAILTEEVGEVARIMARTYGEQSFKNGEKKELGDELGFDNMFEDDDDEIDTTIPDEEMFEDDFDALDEEI